MKEVISQEIGLIWPFQKL